MNEIHFLMSCKGAAFFVAMATEVWPRKSDFRRPRHCSALVSALFQDIHMKAVRREACAKKFSSLLSLFPTTENGRARMWTLPLLPGSTR